MFGIHRNSLFLSDCIPVKPVDRNYYASELETLTAIESSGHLNPIQARRLTELRASRSAGNPTGVESPTGSFVRPAPMASSTFSQVSDPVSAAKEFQKFTLDANQPAIASLQASIPETSAKFSTEKSRLEGEKNPLKQRYDNIIADLTNREKKATDEATLRTARELGRRGILPDSGLGEREISEATNPITSEYSVLRKDAGISQEEGLRGIDNLIALLTGQESGETRAIKNAIAQLQTGDPVNAVTSALNLIQQNNQSDYQNRSLELQRLIADRENSLSERQLSLASQPKQPDRYATLGEGSTLYDLLSGRALYTAPKTYKPEGSGDGW